MGLIARPATHDLYQRWDAFQQEREVRELGGRMIEYTVDPDLDELGELLHVAAPLRMSHERAALRHAALSPWAAANAPEEYRAGLGNAELPRR